LDLSHATPNDQPTKQPITTMTEAEFKQRTKTLALQVIRFVDELPRSRSADVLTGQLLRSATSVAANYRSACRAKSVADMIAKLSIVEEEADESGLWMELLVESGKTRAEILAKLRHETEEILAMTVASIKTLRAKPPTNLKSRI
jgi:four helix bundle protein